MPNRIGVQLVTWLVVLGDLHLGNDHFGSAIINEGGKNVIIRG